LIFFLHVLVKHLFFPSVVVGIEPGPQTC
jgi:hypothetical protein